MLYLAHLSAFSCLFPLLLFFLKGNFKREWLIFILITASALCELVSYLTILSKLSNVSLLTIYTFLEGSLILLIISKKIYTKITALIVYICILLLALFTCTTFYNELSNDIQNSAETIFILGFSVYYFIYLFQKADVPLLTQYSFFWINSAFLFYFAINLFISGAEHFFVNSRGGYLNFFWAYHLVSNIIYNVMLAIGVWKMAGK